MNKVLALIIILAIFLGGVVIGFTMGNINSNSGPINLNPLSSSCEYNGKTYKEGDGFSDIDGRNQCGCENGQVVCTLMACE